MSIDEVKQSFKELKKSLENDTNEISRKNEMTFREFKLASSKFFTDFDERIVKTEEDHA